MVRIARSLFGFILITSLILILDAALAADIPAWINDSNATIYASADLTGTLPAGTGVVVTATKGKWAQIMYKDKVGYVRTEYLTAKEGVTAYAKKSAAVYKAASVDSRKYGTLSVGTKLEIVGANGKFYQVTNGKAYGYVLKSALSKKKPSDTSVIASKVQVVDWSKGKNLFSNGEYVELYDIQSGLTIRVRRLGGTNHAELEPATADDTAKILKMDGGKFSWDSRPVILHVGKKYIAAAINTMPHGSQSIKDNNFPGQFCLHLPGSTTHGTKTVNANHQTAIKYAYKWAQSKS